MKTNRPAITTFDQLSTRQFLLLKIGLFAFTALVLLSFVLDHFKVGFGALIAAYLVLGWRKFKKRAQAKAGGSAA